MEKTDSAVVPEVQEEIGSLVVKRDEALIRTITDARKFLMEYMDEAERLTMTKAEDKVTVTNMIATIKAKCKPVSELIEPVKKKANEEIDKILSVEKVFVTYIAPKDAAKTRADKRFLAWRVIDVLTRKLDAYLTHEEEERLKEQQRLQEIAEKERAKERERIGKRLDGLVDKISDLNERKRVLEEELKDESVTDDEAELIRTRIDAIDTKLRPQQEKLFDHQIKLEEKSAPVTVSVHKGTKVAGLSADNFYWEVDEITNIKVICKQIWEGTLAPACVTVNTAKIKQAGNDQVKGTSQAPNIPGVKFIKKRKISVRGRGA